MRVRKNEHITPILQSLHWLPISARIEYKVFLLTHHVSMEMLPPTLKNSLLHRSQHVLSVPQTLTGSFLQGPKLAQLGTEPFVPLPLACGMPSLNI